QDVRNVNWGNTKEEVKKSEKYLNPALNEKDFLKYEDIKLGLLKADLEYSFENNRLISIKYLLRIDGRPISIMHDENVNLSTAISFLNLTSGLISYLENNDLNKGFWNNYRHSIKVAPYKQSNYEVSKLLTKLSEENDHD